MTPNGDNPDSRWHCYSCGDLDYLNNEGLCRDCQPESAVVEEFAVIAMRALCGERERVEPQWRIG